MGLQAEGEEGVLLLHQLEEGGGAETGSCKTGCLTAGCKCKKGGNHAGPGCK